MSLENMAHLEGGGGSGRGVCVAGWRQQSILGDEVGHQGRERWERASVYHLKVLSQKVMLFVFVFWDNKLRRQSGGRVGAGRPERRLF